MSTALTMQADERAVGVKGEQTMASRSRQLQVACLGY